MLLKRWAQLLESTARFRCLYRREDTNIASDQAAEKISYDPSDGRSSGYSVKSRTPEDTKLTEVRLTPPY